MNSKRIYSAIARRLPARLAATTDRVHPALPDTYGPMNGQGQRMAVLRSLFKAVNFDLVLETGTYRGETTRFLAALSGAPVHSAEVADRFYLFAQKDCRTYPNIILHRQDSRAMLRSLTERHDSSSKIFLYLDAHWEADVPRRSELEIVRDHWPASVVLIDDFCIPDDDGYGFAEYDGRRLDTSYLPELPGWRAFYPEAHSSSESGARRGYIVLIGPGLDGYQASVEGLRSVEAQPVQA